MSTWQKKTPCVSSVRNNSCNPRQNLSLYKENSEGKVVWKSSNPVLCQPKRCYRGYLPLIARCGYSLVLTNPGIYDKK